MNQLLTKYDCPFYISRGGHCKKTQFSIQGYMSQIHGCKHAKDISKCMWVKKLREENPFFNDK